MKESKVINYYPELREKVGSINAVLIVAHLESCFREQGKLFYKFMEPCGHRDYVEGTSWIEALHMTSTEFRTAFKHIGVVYKSKKEFNLSQDKFQGKMYLSYYDRISKLTYYMRNDDLVNRKLEEILEETIQRETTQMETIQREDEVRKPETNACERNSIEKRSMALETTERLEIEYTQDKEETESISSKAGDVRSKSISSKAGNVGSEGISSRTREMEVESENIRSRSAYIETRNENINSREIDMETRNEDISGREVYVESRNEDISSREVYTETRNEDISSREVYVESRAEDRCSTEPYMKSRNEDTLVGIYNNMDQKTKDSQKTNTKINTNTKTNTETDITHKTNQETSQKTNHKINTKTDMTLKTYTHPQSEVGEEMLYEAMPCEEVPYEAIKQLFNQICSSHPTIEDWSYWQQRKIKKLWFEEGQGLDVFKVVFEKMEASDFLSGRINHWKAQLDWLLKPNHFSDILNDKYQNFRRNPVTSFSMGNKIKKMGKGLCTEMLSHDWDFDEIERLEQRRIDKILEDRGFIFSFC